MRFNFVRKTLNSLLEAGDLTRDSTILAICAGEPECQVFSELGFANVTISNLDTRQTPGTKFGTFPWAYQDAENITVSDASFDFVFVSDGLHHCRSPHRALLEMFRVARKGILVFESRDGLLLRQAEAMGMVETYELTAVAANDFTYGGVNNTDIPNFVYRWTEREFEKAIKSFAPANRHEFRYFYSLEFPYERVRAYKSVAKRAMFTVAAGLCRVFGALFPRQGNSFAMVCLKPDGQSGLLPWIELHDGRPTISRPFVKQQLRL